MRDDATPSTPDPAEFSVDEVMLNTWLEDAGDYLRLESPEMAPVEPQPEQP